METASDCPTRGMDLDLHIRQGSGGGGAEGAGRYTGTGGSTPGEMPRGPHRAGGGCHGNSSNWGYFPSGGLGLVVLIVLVLVLTGRL